MEITAQQYISNSKDEKSFVKVFKHFFSSTEKKVDKQGDIYGLMNISAEQSVKVERVSKFVWDSIVDGYLYSNAPTTNESLKDAIGQGVKKVKDLIANDSELEQTGVDISFSIVLVKDEGIYVGIFGENDIYTFKKETLVNVSDILKEKRANTAGIALEESDILMISSSELLSATASRLSVLESKEDFVKTLDAIGENLSGTKALLYFVKGEVKRNTVKERKKIVRGLEGIKIGAEKFLKPVARVEKVKKPKEESGLSKLIEKYQLKERWLRFRRRLSEIFGKAKIFLKEKWQVVGEKFVENFGKKRWYKKIASRFSQMNIGKKRSAGIMGMKIDDYKTRDLRGKRFKILFMFLLVIGLLAVGINFTIKMKNAREISKLANDSFVKVEDLLKKSENSFVTDRVSAETYLFQAEKMLDEIPNDLNEKDMVKFKELEERVLNVGDTLYKRMGFTDKNGMSNFLDSRLSFGEGSDVTDIAIYLDDLGSEYLFVSDKGKKSVFRVSLYDKSVKALPDNEGYISFPDHVYVGTKGVYVFDRSEGVLKAAFDGEGWFSSFAPLSGLGISDIKTESIAEMTVWTLSDNVYFLSKDRKALLKSTPAYGDRYGLTYAYFSDERFENATDVVADLSIYVTIPGEPHLLRYNYNFFESTYKEAPLEVSGFDGDFGNLTRAYTGDNLDYSLYLFDLGSRRFLKFEKPIEAGVDMRHPNQISLLTQYVYRGEKDSVLKDVKNFVVDSKEGNMYILDGSVIWKLGL